jgi:hypothetical protein
MVGRSLRATACAVALAAGAAVSGLGAGWTSAAPAVLPPAVRQLQAQMSAQQKALSTLLDIQRRMVVTGTQGQQAAQVASVRVTTALHTTQDVLYSLGADGSGLTASDSQAGGLLTRLERDARDATRIANKDTAAAGITQAQLDDVTRRQAAFASAIAGQQKTNGSIPTAASTPVYGFGGSQTLPVSAESLDRYLESKGSPIAGQGAVLLQAGERWNVDPRLVVAISGAESAFGLITCAPHNAWGYGCPSGPFAFRTWADAINEVTMGLRQHYLDDGLTTVDSIHLKWAPPAASNDPNGLNLVWADNVAKFLDEQGGNPQDVSGPPNGQFTTNNA